MSLIETVAPQMLTYRKEFHTDNDVNWLPYLMFFHPKSCCSTVVNTDELGFRFSQLGSRRYSVANGSRLSAGRLIAGNSVAFGIGASSDSATIASRLMAHDKRDEPWLNFAGRAFNSAQELILLMLYRHALPKIEEIVLFSGANNLLLSRLSEHHIQEHGAFYNSGLFFDRLGGRGGNGRLGFLGRSRKSYPPDNDLSMDQRIALAADLTLRHLVGWKAVANDMGAKLTYILQPMSGWVRDKGCEVEEALFVELSRLSRFTTISREVLRQEVCSMYASLIEAGTREQGISFVNMSALLRAEVSDEQWLFVDHTHLTDQGYDWVARLILEYTR